MTDFPEYDDTDTSGFNESGFPNSGELRSAASARTRDALLNMARSFAMPAIYRPAYPGGPDTVPDVSPSVGMEYLRHIEQAARDQVLGYIHAARESEYSWDQIGRSLNLGLPPDREFRYPDHVAADAAFTYATQNPDTEHAPGSARSIAWLCRSCDHAITDQGPGNDPARSEHGHAAGCSRQASYAARLPPEWDTGWEAGQ